MKPTSSRIACALAICLILPTSNAGLLDGVSKGVSAVTGVGGGSDVASVMSFDDLDGQLGSLNSTFISALRSMLTAQAITMSALGLKDQAAALTSEAKSLEGKNDLNMVKRSITLSQDASKELDTKLAQSQVADANAKVELAKAVPHYGDGMVNTVQLPGEYANWATNAMESANALKSNPKKAGEYVTKVNEVKEVTKGLPTLFGAWETTTGNFIKFCKQNEIDTGDLASKI